MTKLSIENLQIGYKKATWSNKRCTFTPMTSIRFIFGDLNEKLCTYWEECIATIRDDDQKLFTVHHGPLDSLQDEFDCIVSPANSYARLDGSFDHVISKMFSPGDLSAVTNHCQKYVYRVNNGYVSPGSALLIPMHHFNESKYGCRYIALCPTMRVPDSCTWNREVVYNCMWNLLSEIERHNTVHAKKDQETEMIRSVFVTGLGTGVGGFSLQTCAQQMVLAWKHFRVNSEKRANNNSSTTWSEMHEWNVDIGKTGSNENRRTHDLNVDGMWGL